MDDRCRFCDREECPRAALKSAGMPADVRVVYERMLERTGQMERFVPTREDRAIVKADSARHNAAESDCRAHAVDWRARALAAEQRPLTVGVALALPQVQDGSHVVEYVLIAGNGDRLGWNQKRRVGTDWQWRPDHRGWTVWYPCTAMSPDEATSPCRLVPLALADASPDARGPKGGDHG